MAMNDHAAAEHIAGIQEFVAYPEHVLDGLRLQRYAGPDTRMHEVIVATVVTEGERAQEFVVRFWKDGEERVSNLWWRNAGHQEIVVHAVAEQRLHPAQPAIDFPHLRIGK